MQPRIEILESGSLKLVGIRMEMTFSDDRTRELWQRFMRRRHEIVPRDGSHFIAMQIFADLDPDGFKPHTRLEKWAAVEVTHHGQIPEGMESHTLSGGTYAVFLHHGPASRAPETFRYIFGIWLPKSGYLLDSREHFEILPGDYRPDDPDAQEEVWIPVRRGAPNPA